MSVDLFSIDGECGCAAKVPASSLSAILSKIDLPTAPEVIVGPTTLDDAGVYRISDELYLVQTVDYFPPVARDAYTYGQIAAANSLSDVYAMGGRPLTALAVVCFPVESLGLGILEEITRGAVDKLTEAGAVLLGGHSIADAQPKYGLAVTGVVRPDRMLDNAHAREGDALILTKPLGTGVTIMALKAGLASEGQETEANRCMSVLNRDACEIALECGATSCTDVTGFGLLGHAIQMAGASGVSMEMWIDRVPKLAGVLEYAGMGLLSGAAYANRQYVGDGAAFADDVTLAEQDLLFDPQTSGGLLIALPAHKAEAAIELARQKLTTPCGVIGRVAKASAGPAISVTRSPAA